MSPAVLGMLVGVAIGAFIVIVFFIWREWRRR
jgi:hypothetical protein